MNYIDYDRNITKAGELMSKEKPLIDVNAPRRSNMVMLYRWHAVGVCIAAVVAVIEALDRLGALK